MEDPTVFIDSGLNMSSSQVYLTDVTRRYREVCLPCSYTLQLYTFFSKS